MAARDPSVPDAPASSAHDHVRRERAGGAAPRLSALLLAVLLAGAVACGAGRSGGSEGAAASDTATRQGAVFVIDSRLVGPVSVYASRGVGRVRLGTINVSQEVRWPVPSDMVGQGRTVRLILDQVGGPSVATEQFAVESGDVVYLTVTERIYQSPSTLRVRVGG